jgi:hypothetical protein
MPNSAAREAIVASRTPLRGSPVQPLEVRMDTVTESLEEARRLIGVGDDKRAAQLLHTAALECHDPAKAAQIHALAVQGRERAGRFARRRWDEPIRIAEARQVTGVS